MCVLPFTAAFNISLELQGGNCSDQLTLICRHSDVPTDPISVHNGTLESGQLLSTAFPGAMYSVQSDTEHRVTISGLGNVQALDGYIIQCTCVHHTGQPHQEQCCQVLLHPSWSVWKYDVPLWSVCATRVCPSLPNIY